MVEPLCKACGVKFNTMFDLGFHYKSNPTHRPIKLPSFSIAYQAKDGGPNTSQDHYKISRNSLTHKMYQLLEEHLSRIVKEGFPFENVSIRELAGLVDRELGEQIRVKFKKDIHITHAHIRRCFNDYLDAPPPKFRRPATYRRRVVPKPKQDVKKAPVDGLTGSIYTKVSAMVPKLNELSNKVDVLLKELM